MAGNRRFLVGPDILTDVFETLDGLTYPASLNTNRTPPVYFMDPGEEREDERVELESRLENGQVDWQSTGALQSEEVTAVIKIYAGEPGQTGVEALARANALAQVVQAGFRDQTTGRPAGITAGGVIGNYRVAAYTLEGYPVLDDGWGVMFELVLRVEARL